MQRLEEADAALSLPDQPDAARAGVRELDDDQIMEIIKEVAPWRDEPKLNDLLTYEKSPPLFPQATYDVPSYRATKFVRAVERRILSALSHPAPAQDERVEALREALDFVNEASGAALGIAVSGSSHPNPDGVLMELSQKGMALASRLSTTISAKEEGRG